MNAFREYRSSFWIVIKEREKKTKSDGTNRRLLSAAKLRQKDMMSVVESDRTNIIIIRKDFSIWPKPDGFLQSLMLF